MIRDDHGVGEVVMGRFLSDTTIDTIIVLNQEEHKGTIKETGEARFVVPMGAGVLSYGRIFIVDKNYLSVITPLRNTP
jgi:hypothetical protein